MSIEKIEINGLDDLWKFQDHIKICCKEVRHVFPCSIYFKDKNNSENSGLSISFQGHPRPLSIENQEMILKGINAMCNTNFVLR